MFFAGICAGGSGTRFGGALPKQFNDLNGKPVIAYSVEELLKWKELKRIIIAVSSEYTDYCRQLFPDSRITVIEGGAVRSETVALLAEAAVRDCGADDEDILLTHDAARPLVGLKTMKRCGKAAEKYGVSGTAVRAVDTVLRCRDGFVAEAPPREEMRLAQTPQCFRLGLFKEVWGSMTAQEKEAATDVCGMFFRKGYKVRIVEGEDCGGKITVKEDLERMRERDC